MKRSDIFAMATLIIYLGIILIPLNTFAGGKNVDNPANSLSPKRCVVRLSPPSVMPVPHSPLLRPRLSFLRQRALESQ